MLALPRFSLLLLIAVFVVGFFGDARPETNKEVDPEQVYCCLLGNCCGIRTQVQLLALSEVFSLGAAPAQAPPLDSSAFASKIPAALRQSIEAYRNSPGFKACSSSAIALRSFQQANQLDGLFSTVAGLSQESRSKYRSVFQAYDNACLSKPPYPSPPPADEITQDIRDRLGVLLSSDGKPFCNGFLLGSFILTARHCFLSATSLQKTIQNNPINIGDQEIDLQIPDGATFVTIEKRTQFKLESLSEAKHPETYNKKAVTIPNKLEHDWILLSVEGANSRFKQGFHNAQMWDRLFILGVNPLHLEFREANAKQTLYADSMRFDDSPFCAVMMINTACIVHSCQTMRGLSGSPVFRLSGNGRLQIVGIQVGVGAQALSNRSCNTPYAQYLPNLAIQLPKEIDQQF